MPGCLLPLQDKIFRLPNGIKYLKRNRDVDSFILDEKMLNNAGLYVIKQKLYGNLINTYENISFQ